MSSGAEAVQPAVVGQVCVLIVDDDQQFGRFAAELLTDRGYLVVGHATSAGEALAECKRLDPDAVLLDVRLPDGSGVTLASTLRATERPPAILLTSADRDALRPEQLEQSGASGFVPKTQLARRDLTPFLQR
jgi:DNA-binding response OmpR family regulator